MAERFLEDLRRHLLEGGITPRRVTRLLAELHDHHDRLLQEHLHAGLSEQDAAKAAFEQLGDETLLARRMLAQPNLLCWSRRWPWAVYGIGPLLLYSVALASMCVLIVATGKALYTLHHSSPRLWLQILGSLRLLALYALPAVLIAAAGRLAARRHVALGWSLLGATVLSCLGSLTNLDVSLTAVRAGIGVDLHLQVLTRTLLSRALPSALVGGALAALWIWWDRGSAHERIQA